MKRKIRIAKCQREQLSTNTTEELNTSDSSDTNNSDFGREFKISSKLLSFTHFLNCLQFHRRCGTRGNRDCYYKIGNFRS